MFFFCDFWTGWEPQVSMPDTAVAPEAQHGMVSHAQLLFLWIFRLGNFRDRPRQNGESTIKDWDLTILTWFSHPKIGSWPKNHPKWWFFTRNTGISLVERGIDSSQTGILLSCPMDWGVASLDTQLDKTRWGCGCCSPNFANIHHIYLRLSQNDTSFLFRNFRTKLSYTPVVIWVCPNIGHRIPYHSWWRRLSGNQTWAPGLEKSPM